MASGVAGPVRIGRSGPVAGLQRRSWSHARRGQCRTHREAGQGPQVPAPRSPTSTTTSPSTSPSRAGTRRQQARGRASCRASIGYFSPEFGITEVLPQYSGGLGILAGDHLKAASDLGVPIIGVGLLYGAGLLPPVAVAGRLAARALPVARSGWPADPRAEGRRRPAGAHLDRAARVAHAARPGLGGRGRSRAAAAARQRHRRERHRGAPGHRPALRRRARTPPRAGAAARRRRRARDPRVLRGDRRAPRRRCSTPTRAMPASSASSASAS